MNGEVTSKSFDRRPLGFRLWTVESLTSAKHEFIPLTKQYEHLKPKPVKKKPAKKKTVKKVSAKKK